MTTSVSFEAPCRWSRELSRSGTAFGALAALFLASWAPPAMSDPIPNRIFAECKLSADTVASLEQDILDTNSPPPNDPEIDSPLISYVVIYAIDNDNNGQRVLADGQGTVGPVLGFTGPVICVAPDINIDTALQTDDIIEIDILDLQDALILRHAPTSASEGDPAANRICHTTDGNTDCFDID